MAEGVGNPLAWAYTVPDFVWDHLCKNRQSLFPKKEIEQLQVQAHFDELERYMRRHD